MVEMLKPEICPLLPPNSGLVNEFNQLVEGLAKAEQKFSKLVNEEQWVELLQKVDMVRKKLTRTHYKVGFLGTTQDGKSTALNLILGFKKDDKNSPAKSGGTGGATTSNVSRIRRSPQQTPLTITYLTEKQYEGKKKEICKDLAINEEQPEQKILEELKNIGQNADKEKISFTETFINSFLTFRNIIVDSPNSEVVPFDQRGIVLNHPSSSNGQPQASKYCLIYEVALGVPTEGISDKCQLIDLPGLGACSWDSWLTDSYLSDVDGVLIFLKSFQLTNQAVSKQVEKLRWQWGDEFPNRSWLIFSRFKGQDANKAIPSGDDFDKKENFFIGAKRVLENYGLTTQKAILMESQWHGLEDKAAHLDNLRKNDKLHPEMPIINEHIEFKAAFTELLENGGIETLKKVVKEEVPQAVAKSMERSCHKDLQKLDDDMKSLVEWMRRRIEASTEDLEKFSQAARGVRAIMGKLSHRPEKIEKLVRELRDALNKKIDVHCSQEDVSAWGHEELENGFSTIAKILDQNLLIELRDQNSKLIKGVLDEIASQLQDENKFPKFQVMRRANIFEAWQEECKMEFDSEGNWKQTLPAFTSNSLIPQMSQKGFKSIGFDGIGMRAIFLEKTRVASHQAGHTLRVKIKNILGKIQKELNILSKVFNGPETK